MVTEDYVSFEIAKLLKEKGFDGKCNFIFNKDTHCLLPCNWGVTNSEVEEENNWGITLPTIQMAMKWLREVHGIIPIILTGDDKFNNKIIYYWFRIDRIINEKWKDAIYRDDENDHPTYEEACNAAIKYCLENLI